MLAEGDGGDRVLDGRSRRDAAAGGCRPQAGQHPLQAPQQPGRDGRLPADRPGRWVDADHPLISEHPLISGLPRFFAGGMFLGFFPNSLW